MKLDYGIKLYFRLYKHIIYIYYGALADRVAAQIFN